MILVIGSPDDYHASLIHNTIIQRGGDAAYFDTRRFPSQLKLVMRPEHGGRDRGSGGEGLDDGPLESIQITEEGPRIPLTEIESVYWRYFMGIATDDSLEDPFLKQMAFREIQSAIGVFLRNLSCLFINSPQAIEQHRYKGHQLRLLSQQGIRIPNTVFTNDPESVRAFFHQQNGQVIFKPVSGGAHTERLIEADLTPERLQMMARSPVQFQEFIPGTDIRVYVVGDEIFAAEIQSDTLDFRENPEAPIVPVELPDSVKADCITVARTLGLVFSGIDIRRTYEEEYVFLEGNPSPMFGHFQKQTGYPIADRLTDLLMGKTPAPVV